MNRLPGFELTDDEVDALARSEELLGASIEPVDFADTGFDDEPLTGPALDAHLAWLRDMA